MREFACEGPVFEDNPSYPPPVNQPGGGSGLLLRFVQAFLVSSVAMVIIGVLLKVSPESISRGAVLWLTGAVSLLSLIWSVAQYFRSEGRPAKEV